MSYGTWTLPDVTVYLQVVPFTTGAFSEDVEGSKCHSHSASGRHHDRPRTVGVGGVVGREPRTLQGPCCLALNQASAYCNTGTGVAVG